MSVESRGRICAWVGAGLIIGGAYHLVGIGPSLILAGAGLMALGLVALAASRKPPTPEREPQSAVPPVFVRPPATSSDAATTDPKTGPYRNPFDARGSGA